MGSGAAPAYAEEISPPPYAKCRMVVSDLDMSVASVFRVSCQYAGTSGTVTGLAITANGDPFGPTGSGALPIYSGSPGWDGSASVNAGGLFRAQKSLTFSGKTFTPGSVTSYTCTIGLSAIGAGNACDVTYVTVSSAYPTYPTQWYAGGGNGNATTDVPNYTAACSRTLTNSGGLGSASFRAGNTLDATKYVDTYSWDYGDSTTDSTKRNPTHGYGSLGDMPDGGWEATLTLSRDPVSGHAFSDGEEGSRNFTCALRVDFFNPDDSEPLSDDAGTDDSDCPTGIGWLNPLSIGRILRCLFIPTEFGTQWGEVNTAMVDHYPLGPVVWAVGEMDTAVDDFSEGLNGNPANCGEPSGGENDPGGDSNTLEGAGGIPIPGTEDSVRITLLPICPSDTFLAGVAEFVWYGTSALFIIGTALVIYRRVASFFGATGEEAA